VLACGAVEGLLLGAEIPEDPKALGGAQRMFLAAIDIGWAVLASGVAPRQHLDPGCCVTAQPGVKLGVLALGGRDHGHLATAMGGNMGQVLVGAKLAIGHIEEVGAAGELAQAVHVGEDRYGAIVGSRQDEQQLLEVRSESLLIP
jgi:hypothetical protein